MQASGDSTKFSMKNVEFVSKGANPNRSLDLPKETNFIITPRSGSVQMLICNGEILFYSPFNLGLNLLLHRLTMCQK